MYKMGNIRIHFLIIWIYIMVTGIFMQAQNVLSEQLKFQTRSQKNEDGSKRDQTVLHPFEQENEHQEYFNNRNDVIVNAVPNVNDGDSYFRRIATRTRAMLNHIFNLHAKRSQTLAQTLSAARDEVNHHKDELENLIEDLEIQYETEGNLKTKVHLQQLLLVARKEYTSLLSSINNEYSVLSCADVLGKGCDSDDDCVGQGCMLQCRTSGILWWTESVCR